jgi:hypothetical protein
MLSNQIWRQQWTIGGQPYDIIRIHSFLHLYES